MIAHSSTHTCMHTYMYMHPHTTISWCVACAMYLSLQPFTYTKRYLFQAQNIKNFKSQRWQTLLGFNSQRRLLLTGTPLQNNLMELWSLMHFLMPAVFSSHADFKEWFSNPLTGMVEGSQEYNESIIMRLHQVGQGGGGKGRREGEKGGEKEGEEGGGGKRVRRRIEGGCSGRSGKIYVVACAYHRTGFNCVV